MFQVLQVSQPADQLKVSKTFVAWMEVRSFLVAILQCYNVVTMLQWMDWR